MTSLTLSPAQRSQLLAFFNREKDHILALRSLSGAIFVPALSGTRDFIQSDYDTVMRLRDLLKTQGPMDQSSIVQLADDDADLLLGLAKSNRHEDKKELWDYIGESLK